MSNPLMPKATALWLIDNTSLTFSQIAEFCGLHLLEVQTIADQTSSSQGTGLDPITSGQLTWSEIHRCEKDHTQKLCLTPSTLVDLSRKKKAKYTPLSKRQDRPDGIYWILKNYPHVPDSVICSLIGTTKSTIQSIKNKTHWNSANIKPRNPVLLGLCTKSELENVIKEEIQK